MSSRAIAMTLNNEPCKILGNYIPNNFNFLAITLDIREFLNSLTLHDISSLQVRDPAENYEIRTSDQTVNDWHQDACLSGTKLYMIVWSTPPMTELKVISSNHEIIIPPFGITLIDNEKCLHRIPQVPIRDFEYRWFARAIYPKEGAAVI